MGANRELSELKIFEKEQDNILDKAAAEEIKWHFIPARSLHFGELWASAVKSFKRIFYKVAFEAALTFEEATTVSADRVYSKFKAANIIVRRSK